MPRTSTFTQDVADAICERIADGESLRSICDDDEMPNKSTVFRWLAEFSGFGDQYARARETQADTLADDILSIADDGRNDWMARYGKDDAGWTENGEALRRSQLRIDSRKWLAGKMRPKKYGDKLDLSHSGTVTLSEAELDAKLLVLLGKGGVGPDTGG